MKLSSTAKMIRRAMGPLLRRPLLAPTERLRVVCLVLGVLVLGGAATQVAIARATALPDDGVFRMGEVIVTEDELHQQVSVLKALYGVQPPQSRPQLDRFNKDAAKSMAVGLILDDAAENRKIDIADKQARDALDKIIEEQLSGGREDFVRFLGSQGISEREVLGEVKRQLATSRLVEQVTRDVKPVTGGEVRQAFQDRREELARPERRQLRNIVVDSEEKAVAVAEQARAGADFARLAKQQSLDRSTRDKGGDLGALSADQLDESFAKAAFDAGEGDVFGPVKTQHGWNVGQVVRVMAAKPLSFDEVRENLEADLNTQRKLKSWRSWLATEIKNAEVEYADRYRPDHPDAPPTDQPPE